MTNATTRLAAWFSQHLPEYLEDLAPGSSDAALAELEALVGFDLPEDFKDLYRWHDGQKTNYRPGLFYGMEFLSLKEVGRRWRAWQDVIRSGWDDIGAFVSAPPGAVQEAYANPGWIAFAIDRGGNCIGIDLDPGPAGTRGQVINFGRDEDEKFVLAPNLNGFLEWLAGQLEAGNFLITEVPNPPVVERIRLAVPRERDGAQIQAAVPIRRVLNTEDPPTHHFLDSIKVMFAGQRGE